MKKITYLHGIIVIAGLGAGLIAGCSTGPTGTSPMVVYASPIPGNGKVGLCPGSYLGYVDYTNPLPAWGWAPSPGTTTHSVANGGGCAGVKITYFGEYGDANCGTTNVTLPSSPPSPAYQFTVYFPSSMPTTNYPIILTGFETNN